MALGRVEQVWGKLAAPFMPELEAPLGPARGLVACWSFRGILQYWFASHLNTDQNDRCDSHATSTYSRRLLPWASR